MSYPLSKITATFRCNLCNTVCQAPGAPPAREAPGCPVCGSTVRLRSLIAMLSREMLGVELALPDFPVLKSVRGIGMSDPSPLAEKLAEKFDYRNTFYHQPPLLDVTRVAEADWERYDFIVSSEVMEHVPPPVESAFANLYRMLKPDGVLLLTVPYKLLPPLEEHFPGLHQYTLAAPGGKTVLVNRRSDGALEVFENLCFHGGDGSTLELRVFTEATLKAMLLDAGFDQVEVISADMEEFGVWHCHPWSLPVVARKGRFSPPVAELARGYEERLGDVRHLRKQLQEAHCGSQAGAKRESALETALETAREDAQTAAAQILSLQGENAMLRADIQAKSRRIQNLEAELARVSEDYHRHVEFHHLQQDRQQKKMEERVAWVHRVERESEQYISRLAAIEQELTQLRADKATLEARKWVSLGKRLGAL